MLVLQGCCDECDDDDDDDDDYSNFTIQHSSDVIQSSLIEETDMVL
jgi:hypothetical protein